MHRLFLLFSLIAISLQGYSQDFVEYNVDDLPDSLINDKARLTRFIKLSNSDTVIDVGAGKMDYSLLYANQFNETIFYFEDIDSSVCNEREMLKTIEKRAYVNVIPENITIVIGTETSTTLSSNKFDVVILQATLHLIAESQEMINDLHRILKPNGSLIIIEKFTENKNNPHEGCSIPYLSYEEMENFILSNRLVLTKDWKVIYNESGGYSFNYMSRYIQCYFKK
ncbi:MAG: methyltransferase domain-containing protein [Flavobacteriales bacterium]|nr:methyltransferase domain-containing protein [Flavobacteriales bacterium]